MKVGLLVIHYPHFRYTHNDVEEEWPAYSPSGKRIAYTPIEGADGIYSVKAGGGTRL